MMFSDLHFESENHFDFRGFPGFTAEPEMGSLVSNLAWATILTLPPGRRLTDNPKRMIGPGVAVSLYCSVSFCGFL